MLHHWPRLGVFDAGRLDWKKVRAGGFSAVFRKVNPCNYLRENSVVYGKCGSLTNEGLRAQLRPLHSKPAGSPGGPFLLGSSPLVHRRTNWQNVVASTIRNEDVMPLQVRLYRFGVTLRMTRVVELPAVPAPVIYALLAEANGRGFDSKPAVPDGLMLDAPERCRIKVYPQETYNFGFSLLTGSESETKARFASLWTGLHELADSGPNGARLGGNFRVEVFRDLVAGHALYPGAEITPLPDERLVKEVERLRNANTVTLRLREPIRAQRPKSAREPRHRFLDGNWFEAETFLDRLSRRQQRTGFGPLDSDQPLSTEQLKDAAKTIENRLVWLDFTYGRADDRTSLGGAVGRVSLQIQDDSILPLLVWGQYLGAGENLRFGFGRYRIEELGPDPSATPRSSSFVQESYSPAVVDRLVDRYRLPAGQISEQVRQIHAGTYQPGPVQSVWIEGTRRRRLAIPTRADRALQRGLTELLAPAVDQFLEESSFGYRSGLSRFSAAKRIKEAYQNGYRWALKADFADFYDSVDHELIRSRIDAYIADDQTTQLLMTWVKSSSPTKGKGLATGAVISPLLSNLLLDCFDEAMTTDDRQLIRYADDFVLLFKNREEADSIYRDAEKLANKLALRLNEEKTFVASLDEPFRFLGFEFRKESDWQPTPLSVPTPIDALGWTDMGGRAPTAVNEICLPAEEPVQVAVESSVVIAGPGVSRIDVENGKLRVTYRGSSQEIVSRPIDRISQLLVIGTPTIGGRLIRELREHGVTAYFTDRNGRARTILSPDPPRVSAERLVSFVTRSQDETLRLHCAKRLIRAKLRNFAVLADSTGPEAERRTQAETLRDFADRLDAAETTESLLGIEGHAAAYWYRHLNSRLGRGFRFERRKKSPGRRPGECDAEHCPHRRFFGNPFCSLNSPACPPHWAFCIAPVRDTWRWPLTFRNPFGTSPSEPFSRRQTRWSPAISSNRKRDRSHW